MCGTTDHITVANKFCMVLTDCYAQLHVFMTSPAIPDIITVVGSAYFQPVADLVENLLNKNEPDFSAISAGQSENGYSVSITILLVMILESYSARLRFLRPAECATVNNTPDLLKKIFPELPTNDDLREVFLLRNLIVHNHIWHLDVSDIETQGAPTISTPKDLGFQTNAHYGEIVDIARRKTKKLGLNASPTAVNRRDVRKVFSTVWKTLSFMNSCDFSQTPLAGRSVKFRGKRVQFEALIDEFPNEIEQSV